MPAKTFTEARETVLAEIRRERVLPPIEEAALALAAGRVLAEDIAADRDTPALPRSMRDGYAVYALDLPGELEVIGEVRAGERFPGELGRGQAVEIMTGAPVPPGADAVVMIEHTHRVNGKVAIGRAAEPHQNINQRGSEAAAREVVLRAGKRLDYTDIAMLATFGYTKARVFRKPKVALIATGDEIVEVDETPQDFQIRNSNIHSLAAQVERAGGVACLLPVARDTEAHTRAIIEQGLAADLLLLSGGVSAGKYDVVERVMATLDAHLFFDRVLIQPGQPLVFGQIRGGQIRGGQIRGGQIRGGQVLGGQARGKFFFGLPGNPASTMVTFEIFARAGLELLAGQKDPALHMPFARLTTDFHHRAGLTRFLPAWLSADGTEVTPVAWHGSSDVPALTRANAYLVANADQPEYAIGEFIQVLLK